MVIHAKKYNKTKNVEFLNQDVKKINFKKNDFIISFYTMQFINQNHRQVMINKIYKSLNWGGAFFFAEKVRSYDARTQDMMNEIYKEWKFNNGFSNEEINSKTKSLKGVLDPFFHKRKFRSFKKSWF